MSMSLKSHENEHVAYVVTCEVLIVLMLTNINYADKSRSILNELLYFFLIHASCSYTRLFILRPVVRELKIECAIMKLIDLQNLTLPRKIARTAFKENPFRHRICEVFSRDGEGNLSFEDFLDLLSVFSEQAPRDIKVFYAFKIYDFDGDQHIGPGDLDQTLRLLTHQELSPEEMSQIVEKVVEEADVDGDGKLSYMEFDHVITRAPDFLSTFHIRI